MATSYLPFNEPQAREHARLSGKTALSAVLIGFGLGCAAMYAAGGQTQSGLPINMAWTQPAQASRFMQPAKPLYPMQPAGMRPLVPPVAASKSPIDEPSAISGRRDLMAGLAGMAAAGALLKGEDALAAYGDSANVFGRTTNDKGFFAYAGDGWSCLLPSKWKTSAEKEFPDVVFQYEDNFDQVNKLTVLKRKGGLGGSPESYLNDISFLLGRQSYEGSTISEGGFAPDRVSAASVLDINQDKDKKGRKTYNYNILSRTADGNEGGRHQLIKAVESGGETFILRIVMGDKRWFRGQKNEAFGILNSFTVA